MDHDDPDQDEEAAAMAALMGFSTFGTAPPAKKRKFNAASDAFIEGQELEKVDKGGKKGQGSGGNEVRLGKARVFGVSAPTRANEDEINLDDEDVEESREENVGEGLQDTALRLAKQRLVEGNREEGEDEGPQYLDTSMPAPAESTSHDTISADEAAEVQARIDALLNSISANSAPPPPSDDPDAVPEYLASTPTSSINRNMGGAPGLDAGLPARPAFGNAGRGDGGRGRGGGGRGGQRGGGRGGRGGGRNENWHEGYYDPSFNVNPWGVEEKRRGLQAVGGWLEYSSQRV